MRGADARPVALRLSVAIVVATALAFAVTWIVSRDRAPQTELTPNITPSATTPPHVGELTPETISQTTFEQTPEGRALRQALTVAAWADLQMTCDLPEIETWFHPDFLSDGEFCSNISWGPGDGVASAGPDAYEIVDITHNDDGTADIITCSIAQPPTRYRVDTLEPAPRGWKDHLLERSRLVPHGDTYMYLESGPYSLGKREPTGTITAQHFVDWQNTPWFTRFHTADAP